MKTTLYTSTDDLEKLASIWNQLLRRSDTNTLYLTWEWTQAWLACRENQVTPFVIVVENGDGHVVGIAPYYRCTRKLAKLISYRFLQPLGDSQSGAEYPCWIADKDIQSNVYLSIAQALLAHKSQWDAVYMPNIAIWNPASSAMVKTLSTLRKTSVSLRDKDFSAFRMPENREALHKTMSKSWVKSQKRINARFKKLNWSVHSYHSLTGPELAQKLETLFTLHKKRWQAAGKPGSFSKHRLLGPFVGLFAQMAAKSGWLRLYFLEVDGTPVAAQLGYVYDDIYHQLHEGFDNSLANGAGNFLRGKIYEACIDEGIVEYDFLGDHSEHKRRWGATQRDGSHLFLVNHRLKNLPLLTGKFWPTGRFLMAPEKFR